MSARILIRGSRNGRIVGFDYQGGSLVEIHDSIDIEIRDVYAESPEPVVKGSRVENLKVINVTHIEDPAVNGSIVRESKPARFTYLQTPLAVSVRRGTYGHD